MRGLNILIVGGGIGGLEAALALSHDGHNITVLDSVKEFAEAGAGIRIPPNSSRLSTRWGVDFSKIRKVKANGYHFKDYRSDRLLLDIPFDGLEARYGAPYYFLHRADLLKVLLEALRERPNVSMKFSHRVVEYDFDAPSVRTSDGVWHGADLVVAADGVKSIAREAINGAPAKAVDTGDVAYRIIVPAAELNADPELKHLMDDPHGTTWIGPEGRVVAYPLRDGEYYNMVICVSKRSASYGQDMGEDDWIVTANNTELLRRFEGWCQPVQKLVAFTKDFLKWKLVDLQPLNRWVHPSGKAVLLGDSCHPMLPYLAQGAAQATEDAGTLRATLAHFDSLPDALHAYQNQRLPRAAAVTANTRLHQAWMHLYDGPVRDERDRLITQDIPENPIFWANSSRLDWLFGYDAEMLLREDELRIPSLPPMPPEEESVYSRQEGRQVEARL